MPKGGFCFQQVSGDRVDVLENRRTVVAIAGYLYIHSPTIKPKGPNFRWEISPFEVISQVGVTNSGHSHHLLQCLGGFCRTRRFGFVKS